MPWLLTIYEAREHRAAYEASLRAAVDSAFSESQPPRLILESEILAALPKDVVDDNYFVFAVEVSLKFASSVVLETRIGQCRLPIRRRHLDALTFGDPIAVPIPPGLGRQSSMAPGLNPAGMSGPSSDAKISEKISFTAGAL